MSPPLARTWTFFYEDGRTEQRPFTGMQPCPYREALGGAHMPQRCFHDLLVCDDCDPCTCGRCIVAAGDPVVIDPMEFTFRTGSSLFGVEQMTPEAFTALTGIPITDE